MKASEVVVSKEVLVDGLPMESANNVSFLLRNGEGKDFVAVYVVAPGARAFSVLLGEAGGTVASIDLDIPRFE